MFIFFKQRGAHVNVNFIKTSANFLNFINLVKLALETIKIFC